MGQNKSNTFPNVLNRIDKPIRQVVDIKLVTVNLVAITFHELANILIEMVIEAFGQLSVKVLIRSEFMSQVKQLV